MQNSRLRKAIAVLVVLVAVGWIALNSLLHQRPGDAIEPTGPEEIAPPERRPSPGYSRLPAMPEAQTDSADRVETAAVDFDWRRFLSGTNMPPRLPREEVEKYLEQHRRSAESLLAAFHALDDTNYLAEATANFPDDPRVQWTVLALNALPEERRKWLELFKTSSPENALANYLSAENYFDSRYYEPANEYRFGENNLTAGEFLQSKQAQLAINELLEATRKPIFKDYSLESRLDQEELHLAAGRSPAQARFASSETQELLPELAKFKSLAIDLRELQKAYLGVGDNASAEHLTEIGLSLAARLRSGERERLIINQLVASASEAILLNAWDANASYEFLNGQTPKQKLDELKQQRASIRSMTENLHNLIPELTDAEVLNYLDRSRIYGELEAMGWLLQRKRVTNRTP